MNDIGTACCNNPISISSPSGIESCRPPSNEPFLFVENRLDPAILDVDPRLDPSTEATGSYEPLALLNDSKKLPDGVGGVPTRRAAGIEGEDFFGLLGEMVPEPLGEDSFTWLISKCSLDDVREPNIGEGSDTVESLRPSSLDIELTADMEENLWVRSGRLEPELSQE